MATPRETDRIASAGSKSTTGSLVVSRETCRSTPMFVHDVERAAVRADDEVVVLDLDAVHRRDRQLQLQRLPGAAIVERDVDAGLGAEEQQPLALRVFANGARRSRRPAGR